MFGTIVDRLQALLTRNFVVASFFPVLIFAAINVIIAGVAFPEYTIQVRSEWGRHPEIYIALSLACVAITAYILAPLVPAFRILLEAESLPRWLQSSLRRKYVRSGERLRKDVIDASRLLRDARLRLIAERTNLQLARQIGHGLGTANSPRAIWRARLSVWIVARQRRRRGLARASTLRKAAAHVNGALRAN